MSTEGGASPGWRVLPAALLATANSVGVCGSPKFTTHETLDRKVPNGQMYVCMYMCALAHFTGAEILLG